MTRLLTRLCALAAALLLSVSCLGEPTGPSIRAGTLALAPQYAHGMAAAIVDVSAVRVILTRPGTTTVVKDTVVVFPAGQDSIAIVVTVPVTVAAEQFDLTLAMTNAVADTVFRAGPLLVTTSSDPRDPSIAIPTLTYVGVGANAAGVRFVNPPTAADFSQTVPLVAEAFDGQNNVIAGTPIGFELVTLADTLRARIPDERVGSLVAQNQRGNVAIRTFLASGQTATHTIAIQPVASAIEIVSGDGQFGPVGSTLTQPVVARIVAADALPVQGSIVEFVVASGVDTLATVRDTSDATGNVSTSVTLGPVAGAHTIKARLVALPTALATFNATAQASAPAQLVVLTQPTNTVAASTITPSVQVEVQDAGGNVVTTASNNVTLAIATNPGTGTLAGTTTVAAVNGIATFNGLSIAQAGAGYTLAASSGALAPDTTTAFNITVGAATQLAFSTQPPVGALVNTPFTVAVTARDAGGNTVTSYAGSIAVALGTNPTGATLAGTLTQTAVGGTATFTDLALNNVGTGYTLAATALGLAGAASNAFDINVPASINAWINGAGGNWSVAANWSRGVVPTSTDTVWIRQSGSYTVTVDVPATVSRVELGAATGVQTLLVASVPLTLADTLAVAPAGRVTMTGGSLVGTGSMVVNGGFTWSGGSIAGSGVIRIAPGATITIDGTATHALTQRVIDVAGTGIWTGPHTLSSGSGAAINVLVGATLDLQGSLLWLHDLGGAQPIFGVHGVVTRSTSTGVAVVQGLAVTGTLNVNTGTLEARGTGASSGALAVAAGAQLTYGAGNHSLAGPSMVQGPGMVSVAAGATVTAGGGWNVTGTTQIIGGDFDYNGAGGSSAVLLIQAGRKGGTGLFLVPGALTWSGGDIANGGGTTRVPAGGSLNIAGTGARTLSAHLLETAGSGTWTGTFTLNSGNAGAIRVLGAGSLDLQADPTWSHNLGGALASLDVQGALTRTTSPGIATVPGLNVAGTVSVLTGTLAVQQDGLSSGAMQAGTGAILRYEGGIQSLTAGSNVSGSGTVEIAGTAQVASAGTWNVGGITRQSGGTFVLNGAAPATATFDLSGGSHGGTATFNATAAFLWSGGNLVGGAGTMRVPLGSLLSITGPATRSLDAHSLDIAGSGTWTDVATINAGNGALFRVLGGGVLTVQGDPTFTYALGGALPQFENSGTLNRTTSPGALRFGTRFVNLGAVSIGSGVIDLVAGGTLDGTFTSAPSTILRFGSGSFFMNNGLSVLGSGLALLDGGVLTGLSVGDTANFNYLNAATGTIGHTSGSVVRVDSSFIWTGAAQVNDGNLHIPTTGGATFAGGDPRQLFGSTIDIDGVVAWAGNFPLASGNGARIRVRPTGTLSWGSDASYNWNLGGAVSVLENQGTLFFSGAGTSQISANVIDTVGVDFQVLSGQLRLTGGARLGGALTTSGIVIADGLPLSHQTGSTWTMNGGGLLRIEGPGTLAVDSAGTLAVEQLELVAGAVQHDGTLTVTEAFSWLGGDVRSNLSGFGGTTVIPLGAMLVTSGGAGKGFVGPHVIQVQSGATFAINGTGNINSGDGARILNAGTVELQGTGGLLFNLGGLTSVVENQVGGVLRSAGAVTAPVTFAIDNLGTLQVTGDSLVLNGGMSNNFGGNAIVTSGALVLGGGLPFPLTAPLNVTGTSGDLVLLTQLALNGQTAAVGGDFTTAGGGHYTDAGLSSSILTVGGNAIFGGGNSAPTAGRLDVGGAFTQVGAVVAFSPSNTHLTRLTGAGAQLVTFASPGAGNHFHDLTIVNTATAPVDSVRLGSDVFVNNNLDVQAGIVGKTPPFRLIGNGSVNVPTGAGALRPFVLEFNGALTGVWFTVVQPDTLVHHNAGAYGWSLVMSGPVRHRFNAGVVTYSAATAPSDIIVSGTGLVQFQGTHTINGNLRTEGNGVVQMSTGTPNVTVTGDASFGGGGTAGLLTLGRLNVGGSFGQSGNAASFAATGSHRTILNGTGMQNINFLNPTTSQFRHLETSATTRNVVMQTDVSVTDSLHMRGGGGAADLIASGTTQRLRVGGILTMELVTFSPRLVVPVVELSVAPSIGFIASPRGFSPDTTVFLNAIAALPVGGGIRYNNVRVSTSGLMNFSFSDSLAGELNITSGGAAWVGTTNMAMTKLRTSGTGVIFMNTVDANVTVQDSAIFAGGSTNGALTNGSLTLRGAFVQGGGNPAAFSATAAHRTLLSAAGAQTVRFQNPDTSATTSHFANVNLANVSASGVSIESPVYAVNQLLVLNPAVFATIRSTAGNPLTVFGVNADSLILDRVPLRITGTGALTNLSEFLFQNMDPTVDQLMVTRGTGGIFSPNAVQFLTAPNVGVNYFVVNNTAAAAGFTVSFFNSAPVFATVVGPPVRYQRLGAITPAVVNWNGQALP